MKKNIIITVFTPAYNREHLLGRLYESLKQQNYSDFEWVIVDDGSTDNTKDLIKTFIKEGKIKINYIYQKNSGKHIAINTGLSAAKGKYFFIVDSDDYILENVLNKIEKGFKGIECNNSFVGISGLKVHGDGKLIGTTFDDNLQYVDCTSLERKKHKIFGDKAEVFKTEILKNYPFPKIDDERFLPEAYIWNKIAHDGYKIRWFNENYIVSEYLSDGLTSNSNKLIQKNYKGQLLYLKDLIQFDKNFFSKLAHLSSYCGIAKSHYDNKHIMNELHISHFQLILLILLYKFRKVVGK